MDTYIIPVPEDLRAYRWQPFLEPFPIEGIDLTGAVPKMEVRPYRDAPGPALISLAPAAAGTQGLSITVETINGMPKSTIWVCIDELTIEQLLPFPASSVEPGADVPLVYDIHLTVTALGKRRWFEGAFTIVPGATH